MVDAAGDAPATHSLKGYCSTVELRIHIEKYFPILLLNGYIVSYFPNIVNTFFNKYLKICLTIFGSFGICANSFKSSKIISNNACQISQIVIHWQRF